MTDDDMKKALIDLARTTVMVGAITAAVFGTFFAVLYAYQLGVSDAAHVRCTDVQQAREGRLKR